MNYTNYPQESVTKNSQSHTNERIWRAFHTKPRHEKAIAERLQEDDLEVFCPIIETKVRWSDRWKKVKKPLINGYIFARVTESERLQVLQDPGVSRTVLYMGKPGRIREKEIAAIRYLLDEIDSDALEQLELRSFEPGEQIQVNNGALRGAKGEVLQITNHRIRLRLQSLGCNLVATLHPSRIDSFVG